LKEHKLVGKIGISIYHPEELDPILKKFSIDIVQAPFNILDRRLLTSGWLKKLHQMEIEVHVRSVFLQGLLLMDDNTRPDNFSRWQPLWDDWKNWLDKEGLTPVQACLSFVFSQPDIDRIIVGIDSIEQFNEILFSINNKIPSFLEQIMTDDMDLIIPSRWGGLRK
jgi:aryl-alcohol dehydrogenase-like predicted oxidoreductase